MLSANRLRRRFKSERVMDQPNFSGDYEVLLDLVKSRASVRKLKPDPIPDDYVTQILEVGRWAMSGADGLANTSMMMHLAAAALGLGSQHVTIHIQEPFKRILKVPDLLTFSLIMPIGYPAVPPKEGVRRPLEDMVHAERFDLSKYMSNREVIEYLYRLREKTVPVYSHSYAGRPPVPDKAEE